MAKICLDAGHGGFDPGACGNGLKECDIALKVTLKVGALLKAKGHEVIQTRPNDKPNWKNKNEELVRRVAAANNSKADILVSIHVNSASNVTATGIETLCYKLLTNGNKLALQINNELIKATGARDRGIKERQDLYVLKRTSMPACLTEIGFISNPSDAKNLANDSYLNKVSGAIYNGIVTYLQGRK